MSNKHTTGFKKAAPLLLALLSILPFNSHALDLTEDLSINGFYSLSLNLTDSQGTALPTASRTPVALDDGELNLDYSLLGLQADYAITDRLSLTLQGIVSKQTKDSYNPTLEWGYLSYDLGQDLSVRAGQFKLPFLQGMELHYVGFSRLWVRPLTPGSGAGGFHEYYGTEIIKGTTFGDYNLKFQGSFGKAEHRQDAVDNDHVKLFSTRIEKDGSWVNLALFHAQYDVTARRGRTIQNDAEKFMGSIETKQQYDNYILNLGYVYGDAEASPDDHLAYLSIGYRAGRFTPYALYQYRLMEHDASEMQLPAAPGPPPPGPPPPQPKDGDFEVDSYSIGFRYDLGATYAIKAQWEYQIINDDTNAVQGNQKDKENIYSIVFEGVF